MKPLFRRLIQLGAHIGDTVHSTNHFTDYYVLGYRSNYYIIDISKTVIMLRYAVRFLRNSSSFGCSTVMYYYNTHSYEIITLFLYKLSRLFPLNILYQKWIPGSVSNYYSCFYDLLNEIQNLNWVDRRKKISFMNIFFRLLYYISIDRPVDITLEEQYKKSLSYWRAAIFFRYFRNYYYLPDIALCIDCAYSNRISQEFSSLGIPVSAPLNTKSNFQFVSYPVISNNSSALLGLFYLSLFSSTILDGRRLQYKRLSSVINDKVIKDKILREYRLRVEAQIKQQLAEKKRKQKLQDLKQKESDKMILKILHDAIETFPKNSEVKDRIQKKSYGKESNTKQVFHQREFLGVGKQSVKKDSTPTHEHGSNTNVDRVGLDWGGSRTNTQSNPSFSQGLDSVFAAVREHKEREAQELLVKRTRLPKFSENKHGSKRGTRQSDIQKKNQSTAEGIKASKAINDLISSVLKEHALKEREKAKDLEKMRKDYRFSSDNKHSLKINTRQIGKSDIKITKDKNRDEVQYKERNFGSTKGSGQVRKCDIEKKNVDGVTNKLPKNQPTSYSPSGPDKKKKDSSDELYKKILEILSKNKK